MKVKKHLPVVITIVVLAVLLCTGLILFFVSHKTSDEPASEITSGADSIEEIAPETVEDIPDKYKEGHGSEYDVYPHTIQLTDGDIGATDIFVDWFIIPDTVPEIYYNVYQQLICTLNHYFDGEPDGVYSSDITVDIHDEVSNMVFEIYVHGPQELNVKMNCYNYSADVEVLSD